MRVKTSTTSFKKRTREFLRELRRFHRQICVICGWFFSRRYRSALGHEGFLKEPEKPPRKDDRCRNREHSNIQDLQPPWIGPLPRLHDYQLMRQVERIRKDSNRSADRDQRRQFRLTYPTLLGEHHPVHDDKESETSERMNQKPRAVVQKCIFVNIRQRR